MWLIATDHGLPCSFKGELVRIVPSKDTMELHRKCLILLKTSRPIGEQNDFPSRTWQRRRLRRVCDRELKSYSTRNSLPLRGILFLRAIEIERPSKVLHLPDALWQSDAEIAGSRRGRPSGRSVSGTEAFSPSDLDSPFIMHTDCPLSQCHSPEQCLQKFANQFLYSQFLHSNHQSTPTLIAADANFSD